MAGHWGQVMIVVVLLGSLVVIGLVIVMIAAYTIDAESFEVTTTFGRLASFSIKILSPRKRRKGDPGAIPANELPRSDLAKELLPGAPPPTTSQADGRLTPTAANRRATTSYSSAITPGLPSMMKAR